VPLICPTRQAKYFRKRDWTTQISLNRFSKLSFTRMRFLQPKDQASEAASRKTQLICPTTAKSATQAMRKICRRTAYAQSGIPGPRGHVG